MEGNVNLSHMDASNRIGIGQVKTALGDQKIQIGINPKDGAIHAIAITTLRDQKMTEDTVKTLHVAAKILTGEKLTAEDKPFKKTAQKVVDYQLSQVKNKKLDETQKSNLAKELSSPLPSYINNQISLFAKNNPPVDKKAIVSHLNDIKKDEVHKNDGQDVNRHLLGAYVKIKNANGESAFTEELKHTGKNNYSDEQEVQALHKRLGETLDSFKTKAAFGRNENVDENKKNNPLNDTITDFLDRIAEQDDAESCAEVIKRTMDSWRNGNPAEQNLARLMHTMHQKYHVDIALSCKALLSDYSGSKDLNKANCPNALLNIGNTNFVKPTEKNITIDFTDDQVIVRHLAALEDAGVTITQTTTLTAKLAKLDDWSVNVQSYAEPTGPEGNTLLAAKINRVYSNSGLQNKF